MQTLRAPTDGFSLCDSPSANRDDPAGSLLQAEDLAAKRGELLPPAIVAPSVAEIQRPAEQNRLAALFIPQRGRTIDGPMTMVDVALVTGQQVIDLVNECRCTRA